MKRLVSAGLSLGIGVLISGAVFAQDHPIETPGSAVTVVGCMQRTEQPGTLGTTIPERTATPEEAGVLANLGEPGRGFILADATPAAAGAKPGTAQPKRYILVGDDAELATHQGQRVRVNGTIAAAPDTRAGAPAANGTATATGTSGTALRSNTPRLQVTSVETIAAECGQPKR